MDATKRAVDEEIRLCRHFRFQIEFASAENGPERDSGKLLYYLPSTVPL
jgi:hypothetical protein